MHELALFAGAGGGILAGRLLGWRTIAACEIEPYPRAVLLHNQKLGNLPHFPIWDDIRTLDGTPFRGHIDIVTGGFPCQDISAAGKGAGITGTRSGLWSEMHRIIREVQPRYAFMENSPMLTSRGLGRVLGDLAEIGYHAAWCVLGASDCGAPHRRDRIWILAVRHTDCNHETTQQAIQRRQQTLQPCRSSGDGAAEANISDTAGERLEEVEVHSGESDGAVRETPDWASRGDVQPHLLPDSDLPGRQEQRSAEPAGTQHKTTQRNSWWSFEPNVGRVAHGVASRVDRLKALGNGQVPLVAATAFQTLKQRLDNIQP